MADPNINNNNPVMSNLSLEDQAQLVQLFRVEAGMTLTMKKNGAVADGVDVDIAQVCFNNMSEGTKPIAVDYKIEGGTAVFLENKLTTIRKNTNTSLSSTVQLINLTPGKGMIKATPYLNPKMAPLPVEYEFIGKSRKLKLVLTVDTDNQLSDGVAANGVTATLTDEDNKPVKDEALSFQLSAGTAQFKGNSSGKTDADGKIKVFITSNANANIAVTVTCILAVNTAISQSIVVNFNAKSKLPIVTDFYLDAIVANGISGHVSPCTVRAVVVLDSESPATTYYVKFSHFSTDLTSRNYTYFTELNAHPFNFRIITLDELMRSYEKTKVIQANKIVTSTGVCVKGTTDVWVYHGNHSSTPMWTEIRAELLDQNFKHVAYSRPASNPILRFAVSEPNLPPPPPPPPPPPLPPSLSKWPVEVVIRSKENVYQPDYHASSMYHQCSFYVLRRFVPDLLFTAYIISNGQYFALHSDKGWVQNASNSTQTGFTLGVLRSVPSDLGATIEIRAAQGVVWRGIMYPRSVLITEIS